MVLTQHTSWAIRITGRLYVSIPLWFSRNKSKRQNCRKCFVSFHTTMVLTQRTTMKLCRRSQTSRFHTTMVLTQQLMALLNYRTSIAFPYHYGSHATLVMRIVIERPSEFPYHYGSHATHSQGRCYRSCRTVSIPLWFSRNPLLMIFRGGVEMSFHTTMVLTQLLLVVEKNNRYRMFPYHYGSHATAFITKILYRFWVGRINQMGRFRKRHRIYISAIRLDLILDGRSVMWREKASVSSKEERP